MKSKSHHKNILSLVISALLVCTLLALPAAASGPYYISKRDNSVDSIKVNGREDTQANEGDRVVLRETEEPGQIFDKFIITKVGGDNRTFTTRSSFTMPACDVTVEGVYKDAKHKFTYPSTVTLEEDGNTGIYRKSVSITHSSSCPVSGCVSVTGVSANVNSDNLSIRPTIDDVTLDKGKSMFITVTSTRGLQARYEQDIVISGDNFETFTISIGAEGSKPTTPAREPAAPKAKVESPATTGTTVDKEGAVNRQSVVEQARSKSAVRVKNATLVDASTLQAMASANKSVVLQADTMTEDGKSIQGRLYLEADKLSKDIRLGVHTNDQKAKSAQEKLSKWFQNSITVVRLDQQSSFGAPVKIAAKANLKGLDTKSLRFYSYDKSRNKYQPIEKPQYSVDDKGYLHFYTSVGGDIIIADRALISRK